MKVDVINMDRQVLRQFELDDMVFGLEARGDILARVVHWQMARKRSGNHQVKEVGQVSGSGKKIYKQKGTGSARHGGKRAPQFRGGAVIFGPHKRDHSYSLPKKVRRLGLKMALSDKLANQSLFVMDQIELPEVKTKAAKAFIETFSQKSVLMIDNQVNENVEKSVRNLYNAHILPEIGANVRDILRKDVVVLSEAAVRALEARLK